MKKNEIESKIKLNLIDAKRHFIAYADNFEQVEKLLEIGFKQDKMNNVYMLNTINILSSFIANSRVKEIVKLIQIGMIEED